MVLNPLFVNNVPSVTECQILIDATYLLNYNIYTHVSSIKNHNLLLQICDSVNPGLFICKL